MAKQVRFVYHHPSNKEIDEEQVRQAKMKLVQFLIEKALEKAPID